MRRSCQSKKAYRTPGGAGDAAATARKKSGNTLRVYECTFCRKYHLTKTPLEDIAARVAGGVG